MRQQALRHLPSCQTLGQAGSGLHYLIWLWATGYNGGWGPSPSNSLDFEWFPGTQVSSGTCTESTLRLHTFPFSSTSKQAASKPEPWRLPNWRQPELRPDILKQIGAGAGMSTKPEFLNMFRACWFPDRWPKCQVYIISPLKVILKTKLVPDKCHPQPSQITRHFVS